MPRFRSVIAFLLVAMLVMAMAGCASAGNSGSPDGMTGTVEFLDIEGGCWVIRADDGRTLYPLFFPPQVRQQGMRVSFTVSAQPGVVTKCMVGEPVSLLSIEPLSPMNAK